MSNRPENVGILAMEMYTPSRYVKQEDLEIADGCVGKYTKGLGQLKMAFTDDREDITSIYLTVVSKLIKGYNIDVTKVGRLEVGTETLIDKSKSVKTSLMSLFKGNTDIEGITNVNACYGGTAALFNSIAWLESSEWDGRYAIVVCGDIAVYEKGPARPTGGCAAIAMLLGPNAPLVLEPGVRCSHMMDIYDFYKPNHSEYASVDGKLSQWAYLSSVDACYTGYKSKTLKKSSNDTLINADYFDYFCFHSPYNKLVQKGFGRLMAIDFFDNSNTTIFNSEELNKYKSLKYDATYDDRDFEMQMRTIGGNKWKEGVLPACEINQNMGNCYTGSVFAGLVSLISKYGNDMINKRVFMFSYGSGSAASIYSFIGKDTGNNNEFSLDQMKNTMDMFSRLDARKACNVDEFSAALQLRQDKYGQAPMTPEGDIKNIDKGCYYLTSINEKHHRTYEIA